MRISDWSSDVCSSDLVVRVAAVERLQRPHPLRRIPVAENAKRSLPVGHVVGLLELAEGERRRIVRAASGDRSEEHTSELQSLMRISYAVFCLKKKNKK